MRAGCRDQQKNRWLDQCVEELRTNDQWVLPALKQIKDICCLYQVPVGPARPQADQGHLLPLPGTSGS
jgi:hypothetical protein